MGRCTRVTWAGFCPGRAGRGRLLDRQNVDLAAVRKSLPAKVGVQGNLDPYVLATTPAVVEAETRRILTRMRGLNGHIFNLGHGVQPGVDPEHVAAMIAAVAELSPAYHR